MKNERWQPPGFHHKYTPMEFLSTVEPAIEFLSDQAECGRRGHSLSERRIGKRAAEVAERIEKDFVIHAFHQWIVSQIRSILLQHSRMMQNLYFFRVFVDPDKRDRYVWELQHSPAAKATLSIGGDPRSVVRCGATSEAMGIDGKHGIEWVTWNTEVMGLKGPARDLPVYVQPHVFERLYGREGRLSSLAYRAELLDDLVFQALHRPVWHPDSTHEDTVLVEYGLTHCKLGYLVCQVLPEAVVVRTFLFLTMDGTPEGRSLYERLRVRRSDKAYLGLDDLWGLRCTDIESDPILRQVLAECGVGHLFDELAFDGEPERGQATVCRKYLMSRLSNVMPCATMATSGLEHFEITGQ
jgi:hypothetical protein